MRTLKLINNINKICNNNKISNNNYSSSNNNYKYNYSNNNNNNNNKKVVNLIRLTIITNISPNIIGIKLIK